MTLLKSAFGVVSLFFLTLTTASAGPQPVASLDLNRYQGLWYEIASIPQVFQRGCFCVTAQYTLRSDGKVTVKNTCRQGGPEGRERSITGVARVPRSSETSKLKVRFFGPFEGDYWVVRLDPDYQWAVVSDRKGQSAWILSRTRTLDPVVYDNILSSLEGEIDIVQIQAGTQDGC